MVEIDAPGPEVVSGVPLGATNGVVESFDDPRGLGVVAAVEGHRFAFHCTAIADGTRTIAAGAAVTFRVRPGRSGRWEATDVAASSGG